MVKKSLLILGLLFISLLASSVFAADIGYIVKTSYPITSDEATIIETLENEGHAVTFLDDEDILNPGLYDLIIVGGDITNSNGLFDNKNHKTLFLNEVAAKNAGFSAYSGSTTGTKITVTNNKQRITKPFSLGDLNVYQSTEDINYLHGCYALNAQSLAYRSESYRGVIIALREDVLLLDSSGSCSKRNVPLNERNLFFGMPAANKWDANSKTLFINSIDWLTEGEDYDGDTFYYYEDCDDNNENIWQILDGYVDVDEDGYGGGSLVGVCSGEELEPGYSEINGDCDDEVESCNDDCTSLFYYDKDNDFFGNPSIFHRSCDASSDYVDDNNDCDDDDLEINPNMEEIQYDEIDQNCDGAAEMLNEIPDIQWEEDGYATLDLKDYIWNPNNNDLDFYYIMDNSRTNHVFVESIENGVVKMSSVENWNGVDWIIFGVFDINADVDLRSNEVSLEVLPANDAPTFAGIIDDVTFDEDTQLENYIDLNDYFYDIDEDELIFDVSGNNDINVVIDNGLVSFIPALDWTGEETIVFSASDGEENTYSNDVVITIHDVNEAPEFGVMECGDEINEDERYSCLLNASDFEGDELEFSIVDETNLDCNINEENVDYISEENYNGAASCLIRVEDEYSYDEYLLEVNVNPINDAPEIKSYSPKEPIVLMENTDELFSVTVFDIDGDDLETRWFIDGVGVGTGNNYTFNNVKGNYELAAEVSDGEENDTKTWDVFVGDTSDFTCEEVRGYILESNEACLGNLLNTKDSNSLTCCSNAGEPKFSDIKRCEVNSGIDFTIQEPDENDEFIIGDAITTQIKISNDLGEDLDFDVEVYLYDLTDDVEVESVDDSFSVDDGKSKTFDFEIVIPDDVETDHEYVVFFKIVDENENYCSDEYKYIKIDREKYDVIVKKTDMNLEVSCGDYLDSTIRVQNIGSKDTDVYLSIENSELGISEKTESFELEKYDDSDSATKTLSIQIPKNISEGSYDFKIKTIFNGGENSITKTVLIECKEVKQEVKNLEVTSFLGNGNNVETQTKSSKTLIIILSIILLSSVVIIIVLLSMDLTGGKK